MSPVGAAPTLVGSGRRLSAEEHPVAHNHLDLPLENMRGVRTDRRLWGFTSR